VLLTADWSVRVVHGQQDLLRPVAAAATCLGAVLIVLVVGLSPGAERFTSHRVCQLAGTRSFSLYLVHWPVIAFVVAVVGPHRALCLLLSVPLVALVTEGFYRLVERPATRLSRDVGRWAARRPQAASTTGA
jgi:peptidoglycan/LPS O-acetylase OafA/YrhL